MYSKTAKTLKAIQYFADQNLSRDEMAKKLNKSTSEIRYLAHKYLGDTHKQGRPVKSKCEMQNELDCLKCPYDSCIL